MLKIKSKILENHLVFYMARKYLIKKNQNSRISNMVMFHFGRCGSTVLARALEQNSQICWGHEILQNIPYNKHLVHDLKNGGKDIESFLQVRMYRSNCKFYGFDTKAMPELDLNNECADMHLGELARILVKNNFSHNIILKRKNYLRRTLSVIKGMQSNKWHTMSESINTKKVYLDVNNVHVFGKLHKPMLEHFKDIDNYYAELEAFLSRQKVLSLSYEDDIQNDPLVAYKKVCSFIGCDIEKPIIKMKRTNPFPLEEMIENIDEVHRYLEGTEYYWMLNE